MEGAPTTHATTITDRTAIIGTKARCRAPPRSLGLFEAADLQCAFCIWYTISHLAAGPIDTLIAKPDLSITDRTYAEGAYQKLRAAISSGAFRSGDPLRERELVQRMGISRTPIREALQRLAWENVLEIAPHRGASVRRIGLDEARELHELRRTLEGQSAAFAAERADVETLKRLTIVAKGSTTGGMPTPRSLLINQQFHEGISRLAGNPAMARVICNTIDLIAIWRINSLSIDMKFRNTAREHRAILRAIATRDAARAHLLMEQHVEASWQASLGAVSRATDKAAGEAACRTGTFG